MHWIIDTSLRFLPVLKKKVSAAKMAVRTHRESWPVCPWLICSAFIINSTELGGLGSWLLLMLKMVHGGRRVRQTQSRLSAKSLK